jgi:hypothetical protein
MGLYLPAPGNVKAPVAHYQGNSQLVARKHYLQVTEEHFARAAQNTAHEAPAARKETQQPVAGSRIEQHENRAEGDENTDALIDVSAAQAGKDGGMGDEGIEPSTAALRVRCSTN